MPTTEHLLHELVAAAGLPEVRSTKPLRGHGFNHEILRATLADSRQIVLRRRRQASRPLPHGRTRFLSEHAVPAPALLGGNEHATLYEYIPGEMLSTLVDEDRMTDDAWRTVGTAFRRVHAVRFPSAMTGDFGPDALVLRPTDPVNDLHRLLADAEPRLSANLPFVIPHLRRLHAVIDEHAGPLRETPTALLHGDVFLANVIVGRSQTTLIDWDEPRVGDPAREIADLDERIHLINGGRLPDAFFETYGARPSTTAVHRLTGAMRWFAHGPFAGWDIDPGLDPDQRAQAIAWRNGLVAYLAGIGQRLKDF
ncbi:aminoglycoside phosphotransferase family protein [Kribbella sp. CWNU-51]